MSFFIMTKFETIEAKPQGLLDILLLYSGVIYYTLFTFRRQQG